MKLLPDGLELQRKHSNARAAIGPSVALFARDHVTIDEGDEMPDEKITETEARILNSFANMDTLSYLARREQIAVHAAAHPGSEPSWPVDHALSPGSEDFDRGGESYRAPGFNPLGDESDEDQKARRAKEMEAGFLSDRAGGVTVRFVR